NPKDLVEVAAVALEEVAVSAVVGLVVVAVAALVVVDRLASEAFSKQECQSSDLLRVEMLLLFVTFRIAHHNKTLLIPDGSPFGGPLPPPPPVSRNGSISRALPAAPQLPSRAGLDSQRGGPRPPLPPDRPGSAAPPPPPPPSSAVRNGFQDPGDGKPSS
ncbi:hypothetical protein Q9233_008684, partial [Columba guinea]